MRTPYQRKPLINVRFCVFPNFTLTRGFTVVPNTLLHMRKIIHYLCTHILIFFFFCSRSSHPTSWCRGHGISGGREDLAPGRRGQGRRALKEGWDCPQEVFGKQRCGCCCKSWWLIWQWINLKQWNIVFFYLNILSNRRLQTTYEVNVNIL